MPKSYLPFLFILSLFACCIEVDISVPSFPDIARYFEISESTIQLTIAYNFLGFFLSAFAVGPLSECYGRRKIMIYGNAIMLIGATLCVYSYSIDILLLARFIQGLGASTSAVVVFAMIADIYQGEKAVKLIGFMNALLTILIAIAPIAGGFINKVIGWQGNYACVAIISLISWLALIQFLPETKAETQVLNLKGILSNYKKLLTKAAFIKSSLIPSLMYSAYMAFVACASFLYMETFGLPIITYAFHQATIVSFFATASIFSSWFIKAFKSRGCIILGINLILIGSLLLIAVSVMKPHSSILTTLSMTIFSLGFAISYPVIFSFSLEIFPEIKGIASSSIMSMRALLVGGLVGLNSYFYNGQLISVALVIFGITVCILVLSRKLLKDYFSLS